MHKLIAAPIPFPAEFCDSLCKETWKVGGGKLEVIGGNVPAAKEAVSFIQQDEMVDAFGELLVCIFQSHCCVFNSVVWRIGSVECIRCAQAHRRAVGHVTVMIVAF